MKSAPQNYGAKRPEGSHVGPSQYPERQEKSKAVFVKVQDGMWTSS